MRRKLAELGLGLASLAIAVAGDMLATRKMKREVHYEVSRQIAELEKNEDEEKEEA